jgi:hypothetical protein
MMDLEDIVLDLDSVEMVRVCIQNDLAIDNMQVGRDIVPTWHRYMYVRVFLASGMMAAVPRRECAYVLLTRAFV